jgi:hypothetical protein
VEKNEQELHDKSCSQEASTGPDGNAESRMRATEAREEGKTTQPAEVQGGRVYQMGCIVDHFCLLNLGQSEDILDVRNMPTTVFIYQDQT